jgi:hypothetical protein
MYATISAYNDARGSSLLSFVLSGVHALLKLFVFFFTYTGVQHDFHFR